MQRWISLRFQILLAACCAAGCGGASPAPQVDLVSVTGKVLLDGQPKPGITVYFEPTDPSMLNGATGVTDAEGKYELVFRTGKTGAVAGKYKVLFSRMVLPNGDLLPKDAMAADVDAVDQIPERYRSIEASLHSAEVTATGGTFDFEIKSK